MTVQVVFGEAESRGAGTQVMNAKAGVAEAVTAGGTFVVTTAVAPDSDTRVIARVKNNSGGAIYVSFGAAPNAGTDDPRFLMLDGETEYFGIDEGDKASVIVAA